MLKICHLSIFHKQCLLITHTLVKSCLLFKMVLTILGLCLQPQFHVNLSLCIYCAHSGVHTISSVKVLQDNVSWSESSGRDWSHYHGVCGLQ